MDIESSFKFECRGLSAISGLEMLTVVMGAADAVRRPFWWGGMKATGQVIGGPGKGKLVRVPLSKAEVTRERLRGLSHLSTGGGLSFLSEDHFGSIDVHFGSDDGRLTMADFELFDAREWWGDERFGPAALVLAERLVGMFERVTWACGWGGGTNQPPLSYGYSMWDPEPWVPGAHYITYVHRRLNSTSVDGVDFETARVGQGTLILGAPSLAGFDQRRQQALRTLVLADVRPDAFERRAEILAKMANAQLDAPPLHVLGEDWPPAAQVRRRGDT